MKYTKIVKIILIGLLIAISASASAGITTNAPTTSSNNEQPDNWNIFIANAPSYYPKRFKNLGVMRGRLENKSRAIEISGRVYHYGTNTKVHSINSQFASIQNVTIGTMIGFETISGEDGQIFITRMWIIPKSATQEKNLDL